MVKARPVQIHSFSFLVIGFSWTWKDLSYVDRVLRKMLTLNSDILIFTYLLSILVGVLPTVMCAIHQPQLLMDEHMTVLVHASDCQSSFNVTAMIDNTV